MKNNDISRQAVISGALLHDIGKFAQRAGKKLFPEYRNLDSLACPVYKGRHSHYHVLYGGQFVRNLLRVQEIENRVLYHHRPSNYEDKLIQLADWLSSGERKDKELEEEISEVKNEPLISIFSQIVLKENGKEKKVDSHYCPAVKIENKIGDLFPQKEKDKAIDSDKNFSHLWNEFKKESEYFKNKNLSFEDLFYKFYYLLEKYTLSIPSSAYKDKPEVSLFHHLKSTSAIATCLYDLNVPESEIDSVLNAIRDNPNSEVMESQRFILLSGDISGIQDFIYSVTSEKALKGLRGRSFYLQILSETIARRILDEFNLTLCNLLYLGGGNFTILLPNLNDAEEKIDSLIEEIDNNLFKAHNGSLGLILSYVKFRYRDFMLEEIDGKKIGRFGDVLEELGKVLAREKRRKFKKIMSYELFRPYPEKIEKELKGCEICGKESKEISEERKMCNLCKSFIDLSDKIKKAREGYIEIQKVQRNEIKGEVNSWCELPESFGYNWWFKPKDELPDFNNQVYLLNSTDFLEKNCSGFKFEALYSPTVQREGKEETMTLEEIGNKAEGIEKYAGLRMDVDNLSQIFSEGLPQKTISRYSMLSYAISLFFSMGIREIVEERYRNCCVVYSGGDDLFILGPWSELPCIAKEIYNNFREYTCNHPKITLSGGIYIAPSKKFPVYQTAKEAGIAEEEAKTNNKNRITFLDRAIKWEELTQLSAIKDRIVNLLEPKEKDKKKIPRTLLNLLYSAVEDKKKTKISRIWLLLYGLKRLIERYIVSADEQTKLAMELRDEFCKNSELKENLDLAVRWAEFLTRKK